jgi:hypothetical protein
MQKRAFKFPNWAGPSRDTGNVMSHEDIPVEMLIVRTINGRFDLIVRTDRFPPKIQTAG